MKVSDHCFASVSLSNDFILVPIVLHFQEQNYDLLTGYDNELIIAFHLSSTIREDSSVSQNLDIRIDTSHGRL